MSSESYPESSLSDMSSSDAKSKESANASLIQQRVEQLYGPGALSDNFYNSKRQRVKSLKNNEVHNATSGEKLTAELFQKFRTLALGKGGDQVQPDQKGVPSRPNQQSRQPQQPEGETADSDLPVMRRLSEQFRAQLPIKKPNTREVENAPNYLFCSSKPEKPDDEEVELRCINLTTKSSTIETQSATRITYLKTGGQGLQDAGDEENDEGAVGYSSLINGTVNSDTVGITEVSACDDKKVELYATLEMEKATVNIESKNAEHFLTVLQAEQARLLSMAVQAERYISLLNKRDPNDDIMGLLRSASGKARLLVSQKMVQFENLCKSHLDGSDDGKFPITIDDLEGFWDIVKIQINDLNSLFSEIEGLRINNWRKSKDVIYPTYSKMNRGKPNPSTGAIPKRMSVCTTKTTIKTESQATVMINGGVESYLANQLAADNKVDSE